MASFIRSLNGSNVLLVVDVFGSWNGLLEVDVFLEAPPPGVAFGFNCKNV